MKKASKSDRSTIVKILNQSFYENQSVNYIIGESHNESQINALMEYSFDQCNLFGDIFLSDDNNACALILYPQEKRFSIKSIWLDICLIFKAIGISNIFKALKRENSIKGLQPKINMAYLWFIGVKPSEQHAGIGTKLLSEVLQFAASKKLPVFLETSTLKNLPWYGRNGFHEYAQLDLGYKLFFLKN